MRYLSLLLIILVFTTSTEVVASSMWCERPNFSPAKWAIEALENSDTIILGKVYSVKEVPPIEPDAKDPEMQDRDSQATNNASSMAELLRLIETEQNKNVDRYDHVVSFEVLKSWKDPIHPIVRTKVHLGPYKKLLSFKVGDIYLVVGRELDGTLYRIRSRCADAIQEAFMDDFVSTLDALTRAP